MSVGLLLITHKGIAQGLLNTAANMLGDSPLPTQALEVPLDADPEIILQQGQAYIQQLDQADGVLILSDIYGGTPCNIGQKLLTSPNCNGVHSKPIAARRSIIRAWQPQSSGVTEGRRSSSQQSSSVGSISCARAVLR